MSIDKLCRIHDESIHNSPKISIVAISLPHLISRDGTRPLVLFRDYHALCTCTLICMVARYLGSRIRVIGRHRMLL